MPTEKLKPTARVIRGTKTTALDVFGVRVTVLGGAAETAGVFSLARIVCPRGAGAPPHTHPETEHFQVLRGQVTVQLEDQTLELYPGDTVHIPSGLPHSFSCTAGEEAEFVAVASPAGHEDFFREADELARSGQFNPETAAALCGRHRITLV